MSVLYQPPLDALIAMLDARTDIPANTYFRLRLSYTIDADGVPVDVSIAQSSQDRDVDKAAIEWGRDVRFSSAPGCTAKRHGMLPMILLP